MFEGFESGLYAFAALSTIVAFLFGAARGTKSADRFTHRIFLLILGITGLIILARALGWLPARQIAMFGCGAILTCAIAMVINAERSRRRYHS